MNFTNIHNAKSIEECNNKLVNMLNLFNNNQDDNYIITFEVCNEQYFELLNYQISVDAIFNGFLNNLKDFVELNPNNKINILRFDSFFFMVIENYKIKSKSKLINYLNDATILILPEFKDLFFQFKVSAIEIDADQLTTYTNVVKNIMIFHYSNKYHQSVRFLKAEDLMNMSDKLTNQYNKCKLFISSILENKIQFAYQPIVDMSAGIIHHYECLARISDKIGNYQSIGAFIPIIEEMDLINFLDRYCLQMLEKEFQKDEKTKLAINLSTYSIYNPGIFEHIKDILQNPINKNRMIIEITETGITVDLKDFKHFVDSVHELGGQIALDDVGTGITSLQQLRHLPLDYVKIDGTLIKDYDKKIDSRFFVQTLVEITSAINAITIAEFVENEILAKELSSIGINLMQGYYFSEPKFDRSKSIKFHN
jgi:EAL domain-containing protein (putative c-di-GMP-specific phosphodiesterase class I)